MRLRARHITSSTELQEWCRELHKSTHHPCDSVHRYAIGLYQIGQAYDWVGTPSEYESYAAACIHIIASCESLEIPLESYLHVSNLEKLPFGKDDTVHLNIYKLQAQIFYGEKTLRRSYRRSTRFNRGTAALLEAKIIKELMGRIPPAYRRQAIYEAMEIMVGVL